VNRWTIAGLLCFLCALGTAPADAKYEGQIVDAETKEPIVGVVVFMQWSQGHPLSEVSVFADAFETLTDEQGRFSLPRYWSWNPWKMAWTHSDNIIIFKSGYVPIVEWWGRLTARKGDKPESKDVLDNARGKPVIILRKASDDWRQRDSDYGMVSPSAGVPAEKMRLLQQESDKEGQFLSRP
jgi:hypothetical protein